VETDAFYRATRMHSADYAVARCLYVRPSVCLPHVGIVLQTVIYILKIFPPSRSPTILVFLYQTGWQYTDGDPPNRGAECKAV